MEQFFQLNREPAQIGIECEDCDNVSKLRLASVREGDVSHERSPLHLHLALNSPSTLRYRTCAAIVETSSAT